MGTREALDEALAPLREPDGALEGEILDQNLKSIAQQIPDNIMVLDTDLRIRFINWTVPGLTVEQVLGSRIGDHLPAADRQRVVTFYERALETGDPGWLEAEYVAADGAVSIWETRVAPLRRGGALIGLFLISANVTERKSLEAQLRRAQKLEAIGLLAGGVAHDFHNLVLTIMGNAEFARREAHAGNVGQYLDEIVNACHRAGTLTQQLLALSRKQSLRLAPIDLNEVIRDLIRMMRRTIPEHIEIDLVAYDRLPSIECDRSQVEQVILNLCLNARDAMPTGGRLVLKTERVMVEDMTATRDGASIPPGDYVALTVSDTGAGIPRELHARVFEPFFTTKAPGEGTGLGLSTAYAIVEAHGGILHIVTEPGTGATFKMHLPVGESHPRSRVRSDERPAVGGETILVAEDAIAVRNLVVRVLEHAGYHVLTAVDGAQAVERVREQPGAIHLALLDMVMPRMSGPDAEIEIQKAQPGIPVLFTSGYSDASVLGARIPKSRIIAKPYQPEELLRRVRRALDSN